MNNYEPTKHKISKLQQQNIELSNKIDSTKDNIDVIKKDSVISHLVFYESEWLTCSIIKEFLDDDCFLFSFYFTHDFTINENQLQNINYSVIFKEDVIFYKELIDKSTIIVGIDYIDEQTIIGGIDCVNNSIFLKLEEKNYRLIVRGSGIGVFPGEVHAKILISLNNNNSNKTIKQYEK